MIFLTASKSIFTKYINKKQYLSHIMQLEVDYIYLSPCQGTCNSEYQNKIKRLKNQKIEKQDVKSILISDTCKCDVNDMSNYYLTNKNIFDCSCDNTEHDECYHDYTQNIHVIHKHNGTCLNVSQCTCSKIHDFDDYEYYQYKNRYYCDGIDLYVFRHNYNSHHKKWVYSCDKLCAEYHTTDSPEETVLKHNEIDDKTINKLLKSARQCGERCSFGRVEYFEDLHDDLMAEMNELKKVIMDKFC